ncbi:MAG: hypothetical protein LC802_03545 [Acidobacteria bacterium]|nr:hypothetical protein [Acidobacteriota bacterium]
MLILVPIFAMMLGLIGLEPGVPGEVKTILGVFVAFILFLTVIFAIPPIVAGYGLLKHKSWARTAGIVSSIFAAISLPFGTALCVYSLWFLFGEGKNFHEAAHWSGAGRGALPNASPFGWEARGSSRARQGEYAPPPQPPNWRDE